ncbi:hypothetical protein P8C59_003590 [Phyllachora maydis]|uniref:Integral membrane protein n=1 Tax=Phyllachora maydis TaxID=1825666 RepID=A0AAD9I1Q6_9PEZI|nr:hypothetical protein P8C59_003590 [Phyllachora maydis]
MAAPAPVTTLFPLASLPACAGQCGVLFDVNGACVPPHAPEAAASVYDSCFCNDPRLAAWRTSAADLCKNNCAAADLTTIENWYLSFCNANGGTPSTTSGSSSSTGSATSLSGKTNDGTGGTWLSTHSQWVVFLVVVVVAITGIWIGSCVWRKHYLAKKDRQYALGKGLARATESGRVVPNTSAGSVHVPGAGIFNPAPIGSAGVYDGEKVRKEKKKWVVTERT